MSMTAPELLATLRASGVHLSANGERLEFDAPAGVLTPGLRASMVEHKAELLALLRAEQWDKLNDPQRRPKRWWCLIEADALGGAPVVFASDAEAAKGAPPGVPVYVVAELAHLVANPPTSEALKLIHEAKKVFGGVVVEAVEVTEVTAERPNEAA